MKSSMKYIYMYIPGIYSDVYMTVPISTLHTWYRSKTQEGGRTQTNAHEETTIPPYEYIRFPPRLCLPCVFEECQ